MVAVVGSFGKTTTTRAVQAVLNCPSVSEWNSWSALALGVLGLSRNERFAAFEVGVIRPGHMRNYARMLKPDVTVVTSIGSEHLLSMVTPERLRSEKAQMVSVMSPSGLVALNGDDPNVLWMRGRTRASVITYGFGEENDVRASDYRVNWPHGTEFRLSTVAGSWSVQTRLIGRTMVYPVLAAAAVGMSQGLDMREILERLSRLEPSPGRMQPMELSGECWALRDDHKSALETITAAIRTLGEIDAPRRIAVMGDITEEVGKIRPLYREIGANVAQFVDLLLLTGRHARSVAVGARRAGMPEERVVDCGKNIFRAAEILGAYLRPGDVVLLKGRYEQRLRRIAFILSGKTVRCRLPRCSLMGLHCEECSALAKGWPRFVSGL